MPVYATSCMHRVLVLRSGENWGNAYVGKTCTGLSEL